ncbi:uncharacterized protein LOC114380730 [Glycine soja]|nr:uncharacterized protein LOC114380730 [Glycine soja]
MKFCVSNEFVSMEILENRRWMYQRLDANKRWPNEFREGVFEFVQFVTSQGMFQMQDEQTRCPCKKCKCKVFKFVDDVMRHLYEEGFIPNYYWWTNHDEELPQFPPVVLQGSYYGSGGQRKELNPYEQMIGSCWTINWEIHRKRGCN